MLFLPSSFPLPSAPTPVELSWLPSLVATWAFCLPPPLPGDSACGPHSRNKTFHTKVMMQRWASTKMTTENKNQIPGEVACSVRCTCLRSELWAPVPNTAHQVTLLIWPKATKSRPPYGKDRIGHRERIPEGRQRPQPIHTRAGLETAVPPLLPPVTPAARVRPGPAPSRRVPASSGALGTSADALLASAPPPPPPRWAAPRPPSPRSPETTPLSRRQEERPPTRPPTPSPRPHPVPEIPQTAQGRHRRRHSALQALPLPPQHDLPLPPTPRLPGAVLERPPAGGRYQRRGGAGSASSGSGRAAGSSAEERRFLPLRLGQGRDLEGDPKVPAVLQAPSDCGQAAWNYSVLNKTPRNQHIYPHSPCWGIDGVMQSRSTWGGGPWGTVGYRNAHRHTAPCAAPRSGRFRAAFRAAAPSSAFCRQREAQHRRWRPQRSISVPF